MEHRQIDFVIQFGFENWIIKSFCLCSTNDGTFWHNLYPSRRSTSLNKATLNIASWSGCHYLLHHFGARWCYLHRYLIICLRSKIYCTYWDAGCCVGQKARRDSDRDRCIRTKRRLLPKGKAICLIWAKLSEGRKEGREAAWMLFHHNSSVNKSDSISDGQPKKR